MSNEFNFDKPLTIDRMQSFVEMLQSIQNRVGMKVSSRGWCYLMEQAGYINKSQFDKVEKAINKARKLGLLPVDFVAENPSRVFANVVVPTTGDVVDTLDWMLRDVLDGSKYYEPDYWEGEEYYIQCVVEKVDLKTLFEGVCKEYNVPVANSSGWQSILQRGEYARRFQSAEERGLKCVLLYGGDFDADGLRIADTMRKNLEQISGVVWSDGTVGYNPKNLIIDRFCLKHDFIKEQKYIWIDNLITGSGRDLASPKHINFSLPYVQNYLRKYGERKCEANALVTSPEVARNLMRNTIESYLGVEAKERFKAKRDEVNIRYQNELSQTGLKSLIEDYIK